MGYQSRAGSRRDSSRGHGIPRHEKAKGKTTGHKHRSSERYNLEENQVATQEEVVTGTLNRLRNLGNQRFVLSPFSEYFNDWLISLKNVMSEFESNPIISLDEQLVAERSQILSNVEVELQKRQQKESSREGIVKSLSENRLFLERIEAEYAARTREIKVQKNNEIKRVSRKINDLKEELDRATRIKTGIFRAVSKEAKAQKVAEVTQRLKTAREELASVMEREAVEEERLREEKEGRKQPIIEQVRDQEKVVESQEIDDSLEARRVACESLVKAVNMLLQRKSSSLH